MLDEKHWQKVAGQKDKRIEELKRQIQNLQEQHVRDQTLLKSREQWIGAINSSTAAWKELAEKRKQIIEDITRIGMAMRGFKG